MERLTGNDITRERLARGWTSQGTLSEYTKEVDPSGEGVSQATISRLEAGQDTCNVTTEQKLQNTFNHYPIDAGKAKGGNLGQKPENFEEKLKKEHPELYAAAKLALSGRLAIAHTVLQEYLNGEESQEQKRVSSIEKSK